MTQEVSREVIGRNVLTVCAVGVHYVDIVFSRTVDRGEDILCFDD